MERKLINYLPYIVRDYAEFQGITGAEQPEFETAWAAIEDILSNQFIKTAGNLGLSRWEKILEITPKGTDTLDDRRFRVLARLNEELPYTLPQLRVILENLCGPGNSSAEVTDYTLLVKVGVAAKKNFEDVQTLLERVAPVNLVLTVQQLFNIHETLKGFTHAQLAWYTHFEVRTEELQAHTCTPHFGLLPFTHGQLAGIANKSIRKEMNDG